jgi:hypothetical protein
MNLQGNIRNQHSSLSITCTLGLGLLASYPQRRFWFTLPWSQNLSFGVSSGVSLRGGAVLGGRTVYTVFDLVELDANLGRICGHKYSASEFCMRIHTHGVAWGPSGKL